MRRSAVPVLALLVLLACQDQPKPAPAAAPVPAAAPLTAEPVPTPPAGSAAPVAPAPAPARAPLPASAKSPAAAPSAAPATTAVPTQPQAAQAPASAPAALPVAEATPSRTSAEGPSAVVVPSPRPSLAANGHAALGAGKCRMCHRVQHDSWSASAHAKQGLDCEGCHGNGGDYKGMAVMKDPAAARAAGLVVPTLDFCRKCHGAKVEANLLRRAHAHKGA